MTRALFWISLLTCTLVGAMHSIIGLSSFEPLSPHYVWFLGSGLAYLLASAFNVAAWRAAWSDRLVKRLVHAANLLLVGFGLLAVRGVDGWRSWLALAAALGLLVAQLASNTSSAAEDSLSDRGPGRTTAPRPRGGELT